MLFIRTSSGRFRYDKGDAKEIQISVWVKLQRKFLVTFDSWKTWIMIRARDNAKFLIPTWLDYEVFCTFIRYKLAWNGCGSVGRAVTSDTISPRFKSGHHQNLYWAFVHCKLYWKDEHSEKEADNGPFKQTRMKWQNCTPLFASVMVILGNHRSVDSSVPSIPGLNVKHNIVTFSELHWH